MNANRETQQALVTVKQKVLVATSLMAIVRAGGEPRLSSPRIVHFLRISIKTVDPMSWELK
jgi:hypothetical protein